MDIKTNESYGLGSIILDATLYWQGSSGFLSEGLLLCFDSVLDGIVVLELAKTRFQDFCAKVSIKVCSNPTGCLGQR